MSAESGGDEPPPPSSPALMDFGDDEPTENTSQAGTSTIKKVGDNISTNTSRITHIDLNNKYRESDTGPFMVYVEHKNKNLGRLFPIKVGHFLQKCDGFRNNIVDIKSVGYTRVKVIFKTFSSANDLINNKLITENDLIAYIPKFFTQTKGLLRMVDTFFSEEYLLNSIQSSVNVVEVERMYRRSLNEKGESILLKRQMVIVSFLGSNVPKEVIIDNVIFPVERYIYPVVQ